MFIPDHSPGVVFELLSVQMLTFLKTAPPDIVVVGILVGPIMSLELRDVVVDRSRSRCASSSWSTASRRADGFWNHFRRAMISKESSGIISFSYLSIESDPFRGSVAISLKPVRGRVIFNE